MRKNYFIIVFIIAISLFCGNGINVRAESYIARSAPDNIYTNTTFMTTVNTANYCNKEMIGRDAILTTDSFIGDGMGIPYPTWYIGTTSWYNNNRYIYDTHVQDSFDANNDAAVPGDKFFVIDDVYYQAGTRYYKMDDSVDYGIVYIISNAQNYLIRNGVNPNTRPNGVLEASWFTQVALWKYQNLHNFSNVSMTSNNIVEHKLPITGTGCNGTLEIKQISSSAVSLWNLANGLVDEAKKANSATFTFHYDGKYTILEDRQKVKTSIISMPDTSSISSYSLDISRAPSGTKVYNESNAEMTSLTNLPSNTRFSLEIPVTDIENFTYDFNITATVSYKYKGYKYKMKISGDKDADLKRKATSTVLVINEPQQIRANIKLNATHVEDSASSVSKIVYIGGLVILLCGFGIVYYNLKPRKQEI